MISFGRGYNTIESKNFYCEECDNVTLFQYEKGIVSGLCPEFSKYNLTPDVEAKKGIDFWEVNLGSSGKQKVIKLVCKKCNETIKSTGCVECGDKTVKLYESVIKTKPKVRTKSFPSDSKIMVKVPMCQNCIKKEIREETSKWMKNKKEVVEYVEEEPEDWISNDSFGYIMSFLSFPRELCKLSLVCKRFANFFSESKFSFLEYLDVNWGQLRKYKVFLNPHYEWWRYCQDKNVIFEGKLKEILRNFCYYKNFDNFAMLKYFDLFGRNRDEFLLFLGLIPEKNQLRQINSRKYEVFDLVTEIFFQKVKKENLEICKISYKYFPKLMGCRNLRKLCLKNSGCNRFEIDFEDFPKLESLHFIFFPNVVFRGSKEVKLNSLTFYHSYSMDLSLFYEHLRKLKVKIQNYKNTNMSLIMFKEIPKFRILTHLTFYQKVVHKDNYGEHKIKVLLNKDLRKLKVNVIEPNFLKEVVKLKKLNILKLGHTIMMSDVRKILKTCDIVNESVCELSIGSETLPLFYWTSNEEEALSIFRFIQASFPNVTSFSVHLSKCFSYKIFEFIPQMKKLKEFICYLPDDRANISLFMLLSKHKTLEVLFLDAKERRHVEYELKKFMKYLLAIPNLKELYTDLILPDDLEILSNAKMLKAIQLKSVSESEIKFINEKCKNIDCVYDLSKKYKIKDVLWERKK